MGKVAALLLVALLVGCSDGTVGAIKILEDACPKKSNLSMTVTKGPFGGGMSVTCSNIREDEG